LGFAHEYRPLGAEELAFVLANHWEALGLRVPSGEFNDPEALAAVARITGGNLRLVQRLFAQISRILEINELTSVTKGGGRDCPRVAHHWAAVAVRGAGLSLLAARQRGRGVGRSMPG